MGKDLWEISSAEIVEDGYTILMSEKVHSWYKQREHEHYAEEIIAHRPLVLNGTDVSTDLGYIFDIFKERVPLEDYPLYLDIDLKILYMVSRYSKPVDISHRWREMMAEEML